MFSEIPKYSRFSRFVATLSDHSTLETRQSSDDVRLSNNTFAADFIIIHRRYRPFVTNHCKRELLVYSRESVHVRRGIYRKP